MWCSYTLLTIASYRSLLHDSRALSSALSCMLLSGRGPDRSSPAASAGKGGNGGLLLLVLLVATPSISC